eukprot:TRINITY_DN90398_c0_g1_i1.p1 TRINITY_DN90398_c0_g1~~TRINITY_DN90398_c0_g1_i1.p1  ORF type:complete len:556 (-),score=144.49 TRINITY_DN90398_c0_g1_i1:49-1716(-)
MAKRAANGHFLAVKTEIKASTRQKVSQQRQRGTVTEWKGPYGWIKALTVIGRHPGAKNGRIYVAQEDIRGGTAPSVGATVDFIAYTDRQGLGAEDVRVVPAGSTNIKQEVKQEAGVAAAALDTLPAPWKQVWSEEHDEWYFWNSETKESSWVRPAFAGDKAEEESEQLPEGWEKVLDEEQGAWYYWHKATKTSQWEPPEVEHKEAEPKKKATAAVAEATKEDGLQQFGREDAVLAQQRVKGRIVEWAGDSGWLQPEEELAAVLHPLLSKSQERIYANWRDVQKGLEPAVDVLVDFLITSDDSGLRAVDVRPQGEAEAEKSSAPQGKGAGRHRGRRVAAANRTDPLASLTKQWAKQDAELGLNFEEAADEDGNVDVPAEEDGDVELMEGPLLPGWEQQWSEEHQCAFYWHKATQQSSWERPSVPIYKSEGDDSSEAAEALSSGVKREVVKEATPLTPVVAAPPGRAMTPVTPTPAGAAVGAFAARGVVKAEPRSRSAVPEPAGRPMGVPRVLQSGAAPGWRPAPQQWQLRPGAARPTQTWRPAVQGAFPAAKRPRW